MSQDIILKAENLVFSYDDGQSDALRGLSLEIARGKKIALMGANGSGKSTFFLCCAGICKPQRGALYFNGEKIKYDKKSLLRLRSKVGIVFQDPDDQLFSASVCQEISFGLLNLGVPEAVARKAVEAVMEELEITAFRHKPTHALSGGQKKLVSIADILVMDPDVMILDEPAAALDPKHAKLVERIVDSLTERGITVLLATHDVDHAYRWADQVVLFHQGKVLAQGAPETVFSDAEALKKTNLEPPTVLKLFDDLCQRGVLAKDLPLPKSMKEIEDHIVSAVERKRS